MATISKRGVQQYQARVRKKGYPEQVATFTTKGAAQQWATEVENAMNRGRFVNRKEAESTTLHDALDRYLIEISPAKKGHKQEINRARIRVAKLQAKIADTRKDFLLKLSTDIVRNHGAIAIEDLNIKGLMRALRLSKSVADASLGELVRQLEYKAQWYGRDLLKIRFTRSTGVCPDTGVIGRKLNPKERTWICDCCGTTHDRDIAAAQVILNIGTAGRAGIERGAEHSPAVMVA